MWFGVAVESRSCSLAARRRKNATQAMSRRGKQASPARAKERLSGGLRKPVSRSNLVRRRIFLIGFMGSGKTSVGRVLGRLLGCRFEDLDERIQSREGRSIRQIFSESGEAWFRLAERAALRDLFTESGASQPVVIALGGGTFVQAENRALLEDAGSPVIFLDAPVDELWRRCVREEVERPLRQNEQQFRKLYEVRKPHYLKADLRVDTGGRDVESVAHEIVANLGLELKGSRKEK
jgi:shikimate kinase